MIILFSNCGFAIIAFLFYLCGSNRVAEVFAGFIVNNCYLIFAVLLIIIFLISFYLVRKNSFKSVKVTATIGFTILDFAKVLIFYLLLYAPLYYLPAQLLNLHNFPFMYGYRMPWRDLLLFRLLYMLPLW